MPCLSKPLSLSACLVGASAFFQNHDQAQLQPAAAANGIPTFPLGWSADYGEKLVLWQGGSYNKTDGAFAPDPLHYCPSSLLPDPPQAQRAAKWAPPSARCRRRA
jgi:hypothetical protein